MGNFFGKTQKEKSDSNYTNSGSSNKAAGVSISNQATSNFANSYPQVPSAPQPRLKLQLSQVVPPPNVDVPVKHNVNGYLFLKPQSNAPSGNNASLQINVPYRIKIDKFCLRVCLLYNSNKGCDVKLCLRFHVCFFWVIGNCSKPDCKYNHILNSAHNYELLNPLLKRGIDDIAVKECLKRNAFKYKHLIGYCNDLICSQSIFKSCKQQPCKDVHHNESFLWKLESSNKSTKLPLSIYQFLEEKFCCPDIQKFSLSLSKDALSLGIDSHSSVDFNQMLLQTRTGTMKLRRFSTPSDVIENKSIATRWIWYWKDDHQYVQYVHATVNGFFVIPFSDYLEMQYQKSVSSFKCTIGENNYEIDLFNMIQTNLSTYKKRSIIRRPHLRIRKQNFWKKETNFFTAWSENPNNERFLKVEVSWPSPEYDLVLSLMRQTLPSAQIKKLERIQNLELWTAYQLKKKQMQKLLGEIESLKEQYMFHGTSFSVIDKICTDNFDWRLFGTSVGNVFGKGAYFAIDARISDSYAQTGNGGYKFMFIAFVLVGSATVGNSDMTYPPINPKTKRCFETTVNSRQNPTIFVKYNSDEYYPAYCVKYCVS